MGLRRLLCGLLHVDSWLVACEHQSWLRVAQARSWLLAVFGQQVGRM